MADGPIRKRHPYNQWAPDARALDIVGDKWTLLIVRDLSAGPRRFVELQRVLPGISTEQLRLRLQGMVAGGLLTRQRFREVPPRVEYALTPRGEDLLAVVGALAQWALKWAWTPPHESEAIDIGAILRAAPGLVSPCADVTAVAEFVVDVDASTLRRYTLTGTDGVLYVEERAAPRPDVRMRGSEAAWIEALGPRANIEHLRIEGDELLAWLILAELGGARARHRGAKRNLVPVPELADRSLPVTSIAS